MCQGVQPKAAAGVRQGKAVDSWENPGTIAVENKYGYEIMNT